MRCLKVCFMLFALVTVPCLWGCSEQIKEPAASESGVGDVPDGAEPAAETTDSDSL